MCDASKYVEKLIFHITYGNINTWKVSWFINSITLRQKYWCVWIIPMHQNDIYWGIFSNRSYGTIVEMQWRQINRIWRMHLFNVGYIYIFFFIGIASSLRGKWNKLCSFIEFLFTNTANSDPSLLVWWRSPGVNIPPLFQNISFKKHNLILFSGLNSHVLHKLMD